MRRHALALMLGTAMAFATSGCDRSGYTGQTSSGDGVEDNLPQPSSNGGPVTGMPDAPGPGPVGADVTELDSNALPSSLPIEGDSKLAADAAMGAGEEAASGVTEPSANDAVTVLDAYYAAIARGEFAIARALWSAAGEASGQTLQQFTAGFADTTAIAFKPGTPGRVDAAAGSRFIEVPVSIQATHADGSVHQYVGTYTLRRAVVDGASNEQRAWRIASADIREVR